MKLSVVIPVYNGADFIIKSYNSIVDQEVEDFEIIYVENNSADNSLTNIEALVEKDDRVKLLVQPKQGAAPARNMGIAEAKGDYVYVFDVDDEIYPNALNTMIKVLDDYPEMDAVFGKLVKSSKCIPETEKPSDETLEVIIKEKPYWGLEWFNDLRIVVGPPGFLYRKRVFDAIGMYDERLKNNEDTAFDVKLGMTSNVAFLDMYVYLYFKHETSTIQMAKQKMNRVYMQWPRIVKSHLEYYNENPVPLRFKAILFKQLYNAMGKILFLTEGRQARKEKKQELMEDIGHMKLPFFIKMFLNLLVLSRNQYLYKFYAYYIVPYYIKNHLKTL
ncbi:MAG: glycosyltransferase [Bacteroidia bacterium]|nr:glycosyltransferase [Bacteroidia bacterium]NNE16459.1 glycosyltransferase family 2 protein [Saprospiraceae bacterium]